MSPKVTKIALYMPYANWTPHFETDLEIAANHLGKGDEVHAIQCRGDLPACEVKENQFRGICGYCTSRSDKGLDVIGLPPEHRHRLELARFRPAEGEVSIPEFRTLGELIDFKYDGADIGEAVASSLVTQVRDHEPDFTRHQSRIKREILTSISIYRYFLWLLGDLKPEIFYVFNGRFASIRPALRAAQKLGIKTVTHERAGMPRKYILIDGKLPQDLGWWKADIQHHWADVAPPAGRTREEVSAEWFEERRGGKDQGWLSFTTTQIQGLLPKGFDLSKRNIVMFNSSEDELAAFATWKNPFYRDQNDAVRALVEEKWSPEFHFWLRMHPNLTGLDNTQTRQLYALAAKYPSKFSVIRPDEAADTYHLMTACEKTVAFGSTAGLEATYWGRPAILLGRAPYEDLDCIYQPRSHAEAVTCIKQILAPRPRESTLKFGYRQKMNGHEYKHFDWDSLFTGKFMGQEIKGSILSRVGLKLSRHLGMLFQ